MKLYLTILELASVIFVCKCCHRSKTTQVKQQATNNDLTVHTDSPFARLTDAEFRRMFLSIILRPLPLTLISKQELTKWECDIKKLPPRWDWRNTNKVTPVRNQQKCGACWAFSAVETIETQYAINKNLSKAVPLSVQEMIDCAQYGNLGCRGGDPGNALRWLNDTRTPLMTKADYPLTDDKESCHLKDEKGVLLKNFTVQNLVGNEDLMLCVLHKHGPLSIAVDAKMWKYYMGGVIQHNCGSELNHAVNVVGYDISDPNLRYIIAKNSWGPTFGDKGYVKIKLGENLCGIGEEVCWVDV